MAIDINALSAEEKKSIEKALNEEKRRKRQELAAQRASYDALKDETVNEVFEYLEKVSSSLTKYKSTVFADFATLLDLKQELYKISDAAMEAQASHTFTNADGSRSIIIGNNVIDGWDAEMAASGVGKVNDWLSARATADNEMFVSIIRDLLKPNKDGVLKASRVLELGKKAREHGDAELIEAIDLLQDAYRPSKTSTFVKAMYKDEKGGTQWLALSMSQA